MDIDSPRRLALQLHALHQADRDWILSRIGGDVRAELESMLDELDSLGFHIDQGIVDSLAEASRSDEAAPASREEGDDDVALVDRAPSDWLIAHLKGEPPSLLACLAALHPWRWLESVSASLNLEVSPSPGNEPRLGPTEQVGRALVGILAQRIRVEKPILNAPARSNDAGPAITHGSTLHRLRKWWPWKR